MTIVIKDRLRAIRKDKNETQAQVASSIGIAASHYQNFERGSSLPNLENTWKLADHFGVSVDYLIGRSDTP